MQDEKSRTSSTEDAENAHDWIRTVLPYDWITVPGEQAFAEWRRIKADGNFYPVVVGDDEDLEILAETAEGDEREPQKILEIAATLSFPDDLPDWSDEDDEEEEADDDDLAELVGEWPEDEDVSSPHLTNAMETGTGKFLERVHILLVPCQFSWQVPAYLRLGNWNECPRAEFHVAALRQWQERYGVELVGANGSTLNLLADRTPATREEALALAEEQYQYCIDIVEQGCGTLSMLAACLMADKWWYFWWD